MRNKYVQVIVAVLVVYVLGFAWLRFSDVRFLQQQRENVGDITGFGKTSAMPGMSGKEGTLSAEQISLLIQESLAKQHREDNNFNRVSVAIRLGLLSEALRMLDEKKETSSLVTKEDEYDDMYFRARILMAQGEREEGIEYFKRLAAFHDAPYREFARQEVAYYYESLGKPDEVAKYDGDLSLQAWAYSEKARQVAEDDEGKALEMLKEAMSKFDGEARKILWTHQIEILINSGNVRQALAIMIEEARREPPDRQADIMHGIEKVKEALGEQE